MKLFIFQLFSMAGTAVATAVFKPMTENVIEYVGVYASSSRLAMHGDHYCQPNEAETAGGITNRGHVQCFEWNGTTYEKGQLLTVLEHETLLQPYFGKSVDIVGDRMVISAFRSKEVVNDAGMLYYYEFNATDHWELKQEFIHTSPVSLDRNGYTLSMSKTGNTLASLSLQVKRVWIWKRTGSTWVEKASFDLTPYGTSLQTKFLQGITDEHVLVCMNSGSYVGGAFTAFNSQDSGETWAQIGTYENIQQSSSEEFGDTISIDGDTAVLSLHLYDVPSTNVGGAIIYDFNGTDWVFTQIISADPLQSSGNFIGSSGVVIDGVDIFMGSTDYDVGSTYTSNTDSNPGGIIRYTKIGGIWENTEQWYANSRKEMTGLGFGYHNGVLIATAASQYQQFEDTMVTRGTIEFGYSAAPTTAPTVVVMNKPLTTSTVRFYVDDDIKRGDTVSAIIAEIESQFPDTTQYVITEQVLSEESGTISLELVNQVGDNALLEEKILQVHCGAAAASCAIVINYERRMLGHGRELATFITIDITYDIDSSLLSTVDGLDLSDPGFEQALMDAIGLGNLTDVYVTSNGGFLTLTVTLNAKPSDDPLGEDLLGVAQVLHTNVTAITNTLLYVLGLPSDEAYLLTSDVDLCPPVRDCSNNGECDDVTGACSCVGNWWGINCETPCECNNGGECVKALCHCEYPWYGLRCGDARDCTC
jgi:hypothetical protein